jgi:transposase
MSNAATINNLSSAVDGRRRRFTPEQKRALLAEAAKPGSSISETARRYGVSPSLLFKWKAAMDDATDKSLKKNEKVVPESEVKELRKRIKELERLAGKQAMKIDILEEAVNIAREKKWISHDGSSNKGGGK